MAELVWLITGCSSGFGQALVQEALSRGDKVIATARKVESLKPLEAKGATPLQLDVTSDQETLNKVMAEACAIHGRIDVLVNNAGYAGAGVLEEMPVEKMREQFETNVFGPLKVTAALLPHFRERRQGKNVFISSLLGLVGTGVFGPYVSSKHALEGMVESLRHETESFGIQTLLIEPGAFRTPILEKSNLKNTTSRIPDYQEALKKWHATLDPENGRQSGGLQKAVSVIVDVVRREGVAEGRTIPFRLPLGTDCYEAAKQKLAGVLRDMEEWKGVILSTD